MTAPSGRVHYGGGDEDTISGGGSAVVYTDYACTSVATDLMISDGAGGFATAAQVQGSGASSWFDFYGPVGFTGPLWAKRPGGPPLRIDPDPTAAYATTASVAGKLNAPTVDPDDNSLVVTF